MVQDERERRRSVAVNAGWRAEFRPWVAVLAFISASLSSLACSQYSSTVRVVDGRHIKGRPIHAAAYGHYLHAVALEAGGDLAQALHHYERARRIDSSSPELSTAIGRVACGLDQADADREFLRALRLDAQYGPAWRERARCALRQQRPDFAVKYARHAQAWAPDDLDTTLTLVLALQRVQQPDEAFTQLRAHAVRHPGDPNVWRALAELSSDQRRTAWQVYAESKLERQRRAAWQKTPKAAPQSPVAALAAGNEEQASTLAIEQRLSPTELGFLALDLGRTAFAAGQAQLALAAAPGDVDAYILALAAAHRAADESRVQELLETPPPADAPSELAVEWLVRVLDERMAAATHSAVVAADAEPD